MPNLPRSVLRRGLEKPKRSPAKVLEQYPELGAKWGPREGFYSKAERIFSQKAPLLKGGQIEKWFRGQGIKQAEIDALDLRRLDKELEGVSIEPDEMAEWMLNRRPRYSETVEANGGVDMDDLRQRAEESARAEELESQREYLSDYYSVEPSEDEYRYLDRNGDEVDSWDYNDDGEPIDPTTGEILEEEPRYILTDQDGNVRSIHDTEDEAREEMENLIEQDAEYWANEADIDIDEWVQERYDSWENFADRFGYASPGEGSFATEYGLEPKGEPRWLNWHHTGSSIPQDQVVNLIQQVKPTSVAWREALKTEIGQREGLLHDLQVSPPEGLTPEVSKRLTSQLASEISFRKRLLDQTQDPDYFRYSHGMRNYLTEEGDFTYGTHWGRGEGAGEIANPVQHIRGFYDVSEAKPGTPSAEYLSLPKQVTRPEDALNAGYTYEVTPSPLHGGPQYGRYGNYRVDLYDPDGAHVSYTETNMGNALPAGRGYEVPQQEIQSAIDGLLVDVAGRDIKRRRRILAPRDTPTGRKGLNISEFQADYYQQMGDKGRKPISRPLAPTTDEGRREFLMEEHGLPPGTRALSADKPFVGPAKRFSSQVPPETRQMWRIYDDERFKKHVLSLPKAERDKVLDAVDSLESFDNTGAEIEYDTFKLAESVARDAGIDTNVIPTPFESSLGKYERDVIENPAAKARQAQNEQRLLYGDTYEPYQRSLLERPLDETQSAYASIYGQWDYNPSEIPDVAKQVRGMKVTPLSDEALAHTMQAYEAPAFPLVPDERVTLGVKRALIEAANTDQDFVAWPYADTQLASNAGASPELFPTQYGLAAGGPRGQIAQAMEKFGGGKAETIGIDFPPQNDPYSMGSVRSQVPQTMSPEELRRMTGVQTPRRALFLTEKAKKKIKEEGLPFYVIPPAIAGALGYQGDDRYVFTGDLM